MNNSRFCKKQIIGPLTAFCRLRAARYISVFGRTRDLQGLKPGAAFVCVLIVLAVGSAKTEARDLPVLNAKNLVEISIDYSWVGWGTKRRSYVIVRKKTGWIANTWTPVNRETIAAVAGSLTGLAPSAGKERCIHHTDDYPYFRILLKKVNSVIKLTSTSNCKAYAPWNVVVAGQLKVQKNGAIGRAVKKLLREIDPGNWTSDRQ